MTTTQLIPTQTKRNGRGNAAARMDASLVLRELDTFCETQEAGTIVPTHTEWMSRLNASERAVRWALDELQRRGKIVRRRGASTYVADLTLLSNDAQLNGGSLIEGHTLIPSALADRRTVVAIATPDHSYFDQALKLLFRQAEAADLSLVCRLIDPNTGSIPTPREDVASPLGFIVFRHDLTPLAVQLQDAGCSVVLVGAPYADTICEVPNVSGDQEQGGYVSARHLLELGHRRLAFFGSRDLERSHRWRGYQRAIKEARKAGHEISTSVVYRDEIDAWRQDTGPMEAFFKGPNAPTGILEWNDHEAVIMLGLLTRIGIRVPDDVSLVGYDDLPEGRAVHPSLTTVDHGIEQQLQAALGLLNRPTPPPTSHTTIVLPNLIRRDSSAPVKR